MLINTAGILKYLSKQNYINFLLEIVDYNEKKLLKSIRMVTDDAIIHGEIEINSVTGSEDVILFSFASCEFRVCINVNGGISIHYPYYFWLANDVFYDIYSNRIELFNGFNYHEENHQIKIIHTRCSFNYKLKYFSYKEVILEDLENYELALFLYLHTSKEIE